MSIQQDMIFKIKTEIRANAVGDDTLEADFSYFL